MVTKTLFKDLAIIENNAYKDKRGYFKELLKEKDLKKDFYCNVVFEKNVIRDYICKQKAQGKFVSVIKGKIFDVAVDLRRKSKTFGKYYKIILSEKNNKSIFIPPGFAHGFCTLEKENYIIYSCTNYRNKNSEIGIRYNDKFLKIKWPVKKPILSSKDKKNLTLKEYLKIRK